MLKKRRHVLYNFIQHINYNKQLLNYTIARSIKFNRNIKNKNHIIFYFFFSQKRYSISKTKSICLISGYKRAIINKLSSSRFIANKLAKVGMIHNYRP